MNETVNEHLRQAAEEVFESLAFILPLTPDEAAAGEPSDAQAPVRAGITFEGPFGGSMVLDVAPGILPALASNMLAEPEPTAQQQHDALKETLNVICGNLLPRISTPREIFHVGAPALLGAEPFVPVGQRAGEVDLALDAGRSRLALYVEEGALAALSRGAS